MGIGVPPIGTAGNGVPWEAFEIVEDMEERRRRAETLFQGWMPTTEADRFGASRDELSHAFDQPVGIVCVPREPCLGTWESMWNAPATRSSLTFLSRAERDRPLECEYSSVQRARLRLARWQGGTNGNFLDDVGI